jgi:geranylgeranyl pyrophosphate synthase
VKPTSTESLDIAACYHMIRERLRMSVLEGSPLAVEVRSHLVDGSLPIGLLLPIATARTDTWTGAPVTLSTSLGFLMLVTRWLDDMHDRDRPHQLWQRLGAARTATLAADALGHAWGCLARDPGVPRTLLVEFADLLAVLSLGELEDVASPPRDRAAWQRVAWRKTAVAYRFAARSGAVLHGDPQWVEAATRYGELLGLGLQAVDDFDGVFGPEHADLRRGSLGTLPVVLLREASGEAGALEPLLERRDVDAIMACMRELDIERATEEQIAVYTEQAAGVLVDADVRPDGPHLDGLLHAFCQRS